MENVIPMTSDFKILNKFKVEGEGDCLEIAYDFECGKEKAIKFYVIYPKLEIDITVNNYCIGEIKNRGHILVDKIPGMGYKTRTQKDEIKIGRGSKVIDDTRITKIKESEKKVRMTKHMMFQINYVFDGFKFVPQPLFMKGIKS